MVKFKNRTENQYIIKALLDGKQVQSKFEDEDWEDYDPEEYVNFGPWLCTDEYQWRIKPEETEVRFDFEKVIVETMTFKFEGVKNELYKVGETVYFIVQADNGMFYKFIVTAAIHDQSKKYKKYVFFISEEYLEKSWQQIPQQMKGN